MMLYHVMHILPWLRSLCVSFEVRMELFKLFPRKMVPI